MTSAERGWAPIGRVGAVAATVVGLHALAAVYPEVLWGLHHFAFLPLWALPLWIIGVGASMAMRAEWRRPFYGAAQRTAARLPSWSVYASAAAVFVALCAGSRMRHRLFGDSLIRLAEVAGEATMRGRTHELDTQLRRAFHLLAAAWGWDAETSYVFLSVAFGGVFAVASLGLARLLGRDLGERSLLFGGMVSGGGILLFCGHIETYSSAMACGALFLWAVVAYAQRRTGVLLPLMALMAAGAMHVLSLFVLPALLWAILLRWGWDAKLASRWRPYAPPVWVLAGVVAGAVVFALVRPSSMVPVFRHSALNDSPYTLLAPGHLLDLFNFYVLVALAGWLGLALGGLAGKGEREGDEGLEVLGIAAGTAWGMWALVNPVLGSMDWDLMSLSAVPMNAFGLYFFVRRASKGGRLAIWGLPLLALSLGHTTAWVVLQWEPQRALGSIEAMAARDPHLVGYRGGVLGVSMLMEGHGASGLRQLERQLERGGGRDPVVARSLAQVYLGEGRFDEAEALLQVVLGQVADGAAIRGVRFLRQRAPQGRSRSRRLLEAVITQKAHPTYFGVLAEFYQEEGLEEELRALTSLLDRSIERAESDMQRLGPSGLPLLDLGALYLRRGRMAEAQGALRHAQSYGLPVNERQAVEELLEIVRKKGGS